MIEFKIHLHPLVFSELDEAILWYESQKTGLGEQLLLVVQEKLRKIAHSPYAFSTKGKLGYREAIINKFPYAIVYKIYADKKMVFVASIHHTSRNPVPKYRNEQGE